MEKCVTVLSVNKVSYRDEGSSNDKWIEEVLSVMVDPVDWSLWFSSDLIGHYFWPFTDFKLKVQHQGMVTPAGMQVRSKITKLQLHSKTCCTFALPQKADVEFAPIALAKWRVRHWCICICVTMSVVTVEIDTLKKWNSLVGLKTF